MASTLSAITGATGLLGSHIAERLHREGHRIRALVRPTSDTSLLEQLGVEKVVGDVADPQAVAQLVADADVVYHCVAKTGNWGSWSEHVQGTVATTHNLVRVCEASDRLNRLLHVSSLAVYGHPRPRNGRLDESAKLEQRLWLWDYYTRAKVQAESVVRQLGERATIIRPSWIYGPRDPANIPALLRAIQQQSAWVIGPGDNLLNMVHVKDVAEAAVRAATAPNAAGQAYNICTDGDITQREFMDLACEHLGRTQVRRRVPYPLVHALGFGLEVFGRLLRKTRKPFITRHGMAVYVRPTCFSHEKARLELGWDPEQETRQALRQTLDWFSSSAKQS